MLNKIMSSDRCVGASPNKLIIVHLFFLLCFQFGSEFKHNQSAHAKYVPHEEVTALIEVAKNLEFPSDRGMPPDFESIRNLSCNHTSSRLYATLGISCACDYTDNMCHFLALYWANKGLTGFLSKEVGKLTHLKILQLQNNKVKGSIPDSLGNLSFLRTLNLAYNRLTGGIPESLGNLKAQKRSEDCRRTRTGELSCVAIRSNCPSFYLDLSYNYLNGSIPESLGNITFNNSKDAKLESYCADSYSIDLSNNLLTRRIPKTLGNLKYLKFMDLSENHLNDSLPVELGNLISLRALWLESNHLTGEFPSSFGQLVNLLGFSISGNYLTGPFPSVIANWTQINHLYFQGNSFEGGNIPLENFNFSSLDTLEISDVATSSFLFPQSIKLNVIVTLVLRNCSIGGSIPPYIGDLSNLKYLDLSFNKLTGAIPDSLRNFNLTISYMSFANNLLGGAIPAWISRVAAPATVDLSFNNFSKASIEIYKKPNVNLFSCCPSCSVCQQEMKGVDYLRKQSCSNPKYYSNSMNVNCGGEEKEIDGARYDQDNEIALYGVNSSSNWAFSSSGSFLSPSTNSSDYIKTVKCGISVDEAPLYEKARLAPVSLKYYGYCLHNGNYSVTLHFAEIVYVDQDDDDPDNDYKSLKKRVFDIYIQGERVRTDFYINSSAGPNKVVVENYTTTVNNSQLEIKLYWAGKGTQSYNYAPSFNGPLLSAIYVARDIPKEKKGLSRWQIALITIGSIIFALLLLLAFAWIMGWLGKEELHYIKVGENRTVPLKRLIAATQSFSNEMEIGKGASGTVYKAELSDNDNVAVKKLSTLSEAGIQKLDNEIVNIQTLRHENLVRLFDIYVGKGLCFLVYEYMKNKSLEDVLLDPTKKDQLDWKTRFEICLGIAKGLKYLHELPRLKMVHRGIKAANILLDETYKPKISDFGFARTSTESDNAIQFQRVMEEASNGYMAPEYTAKGKELTDKYDVYAFGVVVLETVCGKKNVSLSRKNNQEMEILVDQVRIAERKGTLLKDMPDSSMNNIYDTKQVITVLKVAIMCTNISPGVRPTMSQVVSVLMNEKTLEEIFEEDDIFRYEDFTEDDFKGIIKVSDEEDRTVTLKELIDATEIFSKPRKLGKGSFGTVYKAILPRDHIVAVKKLSTLSDEGIDKLNKEIGNFQSLEHDNLARLFDFHLKESLCFLIYEYMENKSLADVLFDPKNKITLDWESRFNICLGIAKGLEYLHAYKMVHRGIKATNILLDSTFKPKISDFGLASAYAESDNDSAQLLRVMKIEASNGYMAPEYPVRRNEVSHKYDVYGFGVVLLEIVCGKKNVPRPSSKNIQELGILVDEVWVAETKGRMLNMLDQSLSTYETKQVITVLKLAVKCTSISPGVRPTMSQVVSVLMNEKTVEEIFEPEEASGRVDTIRQDFTEDVVRGADSSS
ncbi:probable LRR receptor-like serine/threonine-protein kinase At1g53420 isoform X2 [Humulus lupulus]|uniref:probable LRR receptor-like serine/threonine-protein kinase At1g53420 isoform X2 n=1 Tax=Humulus lupulus TaxID=3486 RepID=UPI002B406672|nr:probable LRR receptor-like serine/threonine-protein kinase At1g53420 isoform X2 [Humulus lupulus]